MSPKDGCDEGTALDSKAGRQERTHFTNTMVFLSISLATAEPAAASKIKDTLTQLLQYPV